MSTAQKNDEAPPSVASPAALIPAGPSGLMPAPQAAPFYASWDTTTEEGFILLSNVKNGEKVSLADNINNYVEVTNFYIQSVMTHDPATGEEYTYPWIVLVLEDGTLMSCGSQGVFGSVCDALRFRPHTPWVPAMRFRICRKALRNGRQTYYLLYFPTTLPTKKGK
jgi:hypothetical protein